MSVGALPLQSCERAPRSELVQLSPRLLPGCEAAAGGELWLRALGEFREQEQRLDAAGLNSLPGLPIETSWLALEQRGVDPRSGALIPVRGQALARDVLMLPLARSCPLGDPAAIVTRGAAVTALEDGGLLIAGGDYAEHTATAAARWLEPGETLMREVEGGMLLRRAGASATRLAGVVIVAGGALDDRGAAHDTFEVYVSASHRFDKARNGKLEGGPRRDHGALALNAAQLLLAGGRADPDGSPLRSMELIDAQSGRTRLVGELQIARTEPVLLRLDSGTLLVALGSSAAGLPVAEVERVELESGRSESVASLPAHSHAAVVALEGERVAELGCDDDGACELSLLLAAGGAFHVETVLDAQRLQEAGLAGFTRLRLLALRDGRLLVAAASAARADPHGFLVDLSSATIERAPLTRAPDGLLELADGSIAELDGYGLSLRRQDLITAYDDAPDALSPQAPLHVALDAAQHWQASPGALQARVDARFDLPTLRFSDLRVQLQLEGEGSLLLEPLARPPLRVELSAAAVALGDCRVPRVGDALVVVERAANMLSLLAGAARVTCPLPADLGAVGLALEARAGARVSELSIARQVPGT